LQLLFSIPFRATKPCIRVFVFHVLIGTHFSSRPTLSTLIFLFYTKCVQFLFAQIYMCALCKTASKQALCMSFAMLEWFLLNSQSRFSILKLFCCFFLLYTRNEQYNNHCENLWYRAYIITIDTMLYQYIFNTLGKIDDMSMKNIGKMVTNPI